MPISNERLDALERRVALVTRSWWTPPPHRRRQRNTKKSVCYRYPAQLVRDASNLVRKYLPLSMMIAAVEGCPDPRLLIDFGSNERDVKLTVTVTLTHEEARHVAAYLLTGFAAERPIKSVIILCKAAAETDDDGGQELPLPTLRECQQASMPSQVM